MGTYHRSLTEFRGYPLAASTSPDSPGHAGAAGNSDRPFTRSRTAAWDQPAGEDSENDTNEPTVDEFDAGARIIQNDEHVRVAANSGVDRGLDKRSRNACLFLSSRDRCRGGLMKGWSCMGCAQPDLVAQCCPPCEGGAGGVSPAEPAPGARCRRAWTPRNTAAADGAGYALFTPPGLLHSVLTGGAGSTSPSPPFAQRFFRVD